MMMMMVVVVMLVVIAIAMVVVMLHWRGFARRSRRRWLSPYRQRRQGDR